MIAGLFLLLLPFPFPRQATAEPGPGGPPLMPAQPMQRQTSVSTQPLASPIPPGSRVAPPIEPAVKLQPAPETSPSQAQKPFHPVAVIEDALSTIHLSATGLNRLQFSNPITSAHTNSEAIDLTLEGLTAIVTFRNPASADVLFMTQLGQFLLRLVPGDHPPQTVRIRQARSDSKVAASYQSQLANLIEAAYRREPPKGYHTERPGTLLPLDGALQWWLTLRHRGHALTIDEYMVFNGGAVVHSLEPSHVAQRFPTARAVSGDPLVVPPGGWGRVVTVTDTNGSAQTMRDSRSTTPD